VDVWEILGSGRGGSKMEKEGKNKSMRMEGKGGVKWGSRRERRSDGD
jgi:hypothetical protein